MELEHLQNKILYKNNSKNKLFLVFAIEVVNISNFQGKKEEVVINCLDIQSCISYKDFIVEPIRISSIESFQKDFTVLEDPKELEIFLPTVFSSLIVLSRYLETLKNDYEICTNALASFRESVSDMEGLAKIPDDTIMVVSLKDHLGNSVDLNPEEYTKIFEVVSKSIQENIDIDIESEKEMIELQNDIEIGVIKILPDHYNDTSIKINMELIKNEIINLRDN